MANYYKNAFYDPNTTADSSVSTTYQIAYASISGPTICNIANGPIILEESDSILLQTNDTTAISAVLSILEMNRNDQNG
jgi:hypothetical protein